MNRYGKNAKRKREKTMVDPYQVLGVRGDAPEEEIKRAYKKLSRKYHRMPTWRTQRQQKRSSSRSSRPISR